MEIIKRTSETEKQTVSTKGYTEKMQVSFNNFGHIALRFWSEPTNDTKHCKHCGLAIYYLSGKGWVHTVSDRADNIYCMMMGDEPLPDGKSMSDLGVAEPEETPKPQETLIVLDAAESRDLIQFVKERLQ